ncbi:hypothetical protein JXQ70_14300 [bacterium]|nr:hypothetical protein [bacterium]
MERIVNKAKSFKEADEWDIIQQLSMTPEQRQAIARELKRRMYGDHVPDVREYHRQQQNR